MNEQNAKQVAMNVQQLFDVLATASPDELSHVSQLSNQVVGLRDTGGFNLTVELISSQEVSELRRTLAEQISFEKWVDGFITAIRLVMMFAGGAI